MVKTQRDQVCTAVAQSQTSVCLVMARFITAYALSTVLQYDLQLAGKPSMSTHLPSPTAHAVHPPLSAFALFFR
jgi:hypothetical protein